MAKGEWKWLREWKGKKGRGSKGRREGNGIYEGCISGFWGTDAPGQKNCDTFT